MAEVTDAPAMPSLRLIAAVSIALLSAATARLSAAEYYVATNGNDANAGSLAAPFASMQRVQKAAVAGDAVYVRGGTY